MDPGVERPGSNEDIENTCAACLLTLTSKLEVHDVPRGARAASAGTAECSLAVAEIACSLAARNGEKHPVVATHEDTRSADLAGVGPGRMERGELACPVPRPPASSACSAATAWARSGTREPCSQVSGRRRLAARGSPGPPFCTTLAWRLLRVAGDLE